MKQLQNESRTVSSTLPTLLPRHVHWALGLLYTQTTEVGHLQSGFLRPPSHPPSFLGVHGHSANAVEPDRSTLVSPWLLQVPTRLGLPQLRHVAPASGGSTLICLPSAQAPLVVIALYEYKLVFHLEWGWQTTACEHIKAVQACCLYSQWTKSGFYQWF